MGPPPENASFGKSLRVEKKEIDFLVTAVHHPETHSGRHHTGTPFVVKAKVPSACGGPPVTCCQARRFAIDNPSMR